MPSVQAMVHVAIEPGLAFAVSQTTGDARLRWDPFIRRQAFLDGAEQPGTGVRTHTVHRLGASMISRYVSFRPPSNVGMTMTRGPWFFEAFAGGWQFRPGAAGGTDVTWRYRFTTCPAGLRPVADRIGSWLLGRDLRRRIAGFAHGCADPVVLAAARADMVTRGESGH